MKHEELLALVKGRASARNQSAMTDHQKIKAQLDRDIAEFFARGGQVVAAVSQELSCYKPDGAKGSIRRWVTAPTPVNDVERVKFVRARRRTANQRTILPGSHVGPKP